jgi:glycine hydroxymethyltransferase
MQNIITKLINKEFVRQLNQINLIPSENYCSKDIRELNASILTNKYAEGYPGKRYYQGNKIIDKIETLCINEAKSLFNMEHVNVQPLSGAIANLAVYLALLKPGDKILAMDLNHGGHLSHGSKVNISGKLYKFYYYGINKDTEVLDMNEVKNIANKIKPKLIISGFTAYPRKINFKEFNEIAQEVKAYSMADISHIAGLIACKLHNSPSPFTDIITTTTHKTLRGIRSAIILCKNKFKNNIDRAVFPGLQGGPHMHTIAAKYLTFKKAKTKKFKNYIQQVINNAQSLANSLIKNNIQLISNGTDNHLILINLFKTLNKSGLGKDVAEALEYCNIIVNANTIPFETGSPLKPSGIRIGTPFMTTMGMKEKDMKKLGSIISNIILNYDDKIYLNSLKKEIEERFMFTSFI